MTRRLVFCLLCCALSAAAWGDKGHRMVPGLALKQLPPDVPVLRDWATTITDLGPEPDRWRAGGEMLKASQAPDHYINLEPLSFLATFPPARPAYIEALYSEAQRTGQKLPPFEIGFQPYIAGEVYERLRVSFAEYEYAREMKKPVREIEQRVAFYAGWLSHYVADGAQPLHTTIHQDGWILAGANPGVPPAERGIHSRFETGFVDQNVSEADVAAVEPARLPAITNFLVEYVAYLRRSHALVRGLYELDKQNAFRGAGTPAGKQFVVARLAAGRDMLAAIWTAAWQQSQWSGCLPVSEAPAHTGQAGCIAGTVVGTGGAPAPGPGPVYLNFCEDFRTCPLSVSIPGSARARFGEPDSYKGKKLRFFGTISTVSGRPVIYVTEPEQIQPAP